MRTRYNGERGATTITELETHVKGRGILGNRERFTERGARITWTRRHNGHSLDFGDRNEGQAYEASVEGDAQLGWRKMKEREV